MTPSPAPPREFAVIGDPVAHSLSPAMHNAAYAALAETDPRFASWTYGRILCEGAAAAEGQISRVRDGSLSGLNVTMPHKPVALAAADVASPEARAAGGANVLVMEDGRLHAHNTDGPGAVRAVELSLGAPAAGARVVVCGTGPTSMAIASACARSGAAEVCVLSRDASRSQAAAERVRSVFASGARASLTARDYGSSGEVVPRADIFVDATPRGMCEGDAPIVDTALFHEGQAVLDTVYAHGETALVAGARESGAAASDGLMMLVEQAALTIEIWSAALGLGEVTPPREVMRAAALA